ncbi:MAG: hypothetical protein DMF88_05625 [Acidobacteria bacterium]|nr:MAG: hypothetical protein DMF88_05625 [Acidobacteriota bacterium]
MKRWEDMMLRRVSVAGRRVTQFTALILAILLAPSVAARAQVANAVITGIVTDAQGGVLPGVTITVRNVESGVTRTIVTEADGRYRLGGIPPGRYNLIAELQGFATVDVKEVTLTLGLEYPRDFTMGVQGVQESITVTGEAPVIETTKTEVAAVVTQDQIETLPTGDPGFRPARRRTWWTESRMPPRSAVSSGTTFRRPPFASSSSTRVRYRPSTGSGPAASSPSPPRAAPTTCMARRSTSSATSC